MLLAFRPGQVPEVELHLQVAGDNVQNNRLNLGEPLGNAHYIGEYDPDVAEAALLQGQSPDAAADDGGVDVAGGEAALPDGQQGGNGLAAQIGGVVNR